MLCLFGGYDSSTYYNDFWAFDVINFYWKHSSISGIIPSPRAYHAADSSGDALLIFGGEGNAGLLNDMFIYNYITNSWTEIKPNSLNIPSPRKGACIIFQAPFAYIFGGESYFDSSNELWQYDFRTNSYTILSVSAVSLSISKCNIVDNIICIAGGTDRNSGWGYVGYMHYNLISKIWNYINIYQDGTRTDYTLQLLINNIFLYYISEANWAFQFWSRDSNFYTINMIFSGVNPLMTYFQSKLYFYSGISISSNVLYINKLDMLENFSFIDFGNILQSFNFSVLCSPGSYLYNNECILCPKGTYAEGYNNSICTQCGIGKFNPHIGGNSKKQCYPCYTGTYSNTLGTERCLDCDYGDYCEIGTYLPQKHNASNLYNNIQPLKYSSKNYSDYIFFFQLIFGVSMFGILIIGIIKKIQFKKIDMFKSNHSYQIGTPIINSTTHIGGIFSTIFIAVSIILALSAVLIYSLENIAELKVLQPLSVLQYEVDNFYSDIQIISIFKNYGDLCNVNNSCSADIKATPYDFDILYNYNYTCQQNSGSCIVTFSCYKCVIGSQSSVKFSLQSTYSYSSSITLIVTSTSSIPESKSSVYDSINTQPNQVFVGPINSIFYFLMTPSLFVSYVSEFQSNITGYHVSKDINPIPGSIYSINELAIAFKLGVVVYLTQNSSGLYTERYQIQTFIILISAILGSIAGMLGAIRFLMCFIEEKWMKFSKTRAKSKRIFPVIKSQRNMLMINLKREVTDKRKVFPEPMHEITEVLSSIQLLK